MTQILFWTAIKLGAALLVLAMLDYAYQWWRHEQDLKMTPQELREELRNLEGNPQVIARRKQVAARSGVATAFSLGAAGRRRADQPRTTVGRRTLRSGDDVGAGCDSEGFGRRGRAHPPRGRRVGRCGGRAGAAGQRPLSPRRTPSAYSNRPVRGRGRSADACGGQKVGDWGQKLPPRKTGLLPKPSLAKNSRSLASLRLIFLWRPATKIGTVPKVSSSDRSVSVERTTNTFFMAKSLYFRGDKRSIRPAKYQNAAN